jgi:hypothetical protein
VLIFSACYCVCIKQLKTTFLYTFLSLAAEYRSTGMTTIHFSRPPYFFVWRKLTHQLFPYILLSRFSICERYRTARCMRRKNWGERGFFRVRKQSREPFEPMELRLLPALTFKCSRSSVIKSPSQTIFMAKYPLVYKLQVDDNGRKKLLWRIATTCRTSGELTDIKQNNERIYIFFIIVQSFCSHRMKRT